MRLDTLLSSLLGLKLPAARSLVASGAVSLHGKLQSNPRWQVVLGEEAAIAVDGQPVTQIGRSPFAHYVLLMHKPRGYCSEKKTRSHRSLYSLVPEEHAHASLGAFGRLDVDTTGLLLMGTDGGLQSLLMHPSTGCEKAYIAALRVDGTLRLRDTAAAEFAAGERLRVVGFAYSGPPSYALHLILVFLTQ